MTSLDIYQTLYQSPVLEPLVGSYSDGTNTNSVKAISHGDAEPSLDLEGVEIVVYKTPELINMPAFGHPVIRKAFEVRIKSRADDDLSRVAVAIARLYPDCEISPTIKPARIGDTLIDAQIRLDIFN